MSALAIIAKAGVKVSIEPSGGLRLKGLSRLTTEQKKQIIDYARTHKPVIISELTQNCVPGDCESCPAAGYWDFMGPGKWCFHHAYFLGKSGHPKPCKTAMNDCPLDITKLDK